MFCSFLIYEQGNTVVSAENKGVHIRFIL